MTYSFPLLNLPTAAILHVVKSMDYGEFLNLSFLSKRAKKSIELMNLKCDELSIYIGDFVHMNMSIGTKRMEWKFYYFLKKNIDEDVEEVQDEEEVDEVEADVFALPDNVELLIFDGVSSKAEWYMERLTVKNWIQHFMTIFHFSEIPHLDFSRSSSIFSIEEIKDSMISINKLSVSSDTGFDIDYLLSNFHSKYLHLGLGVFETLKKPENIMIRNYDMLRIYLNRDHPSTIILDDLLLFNSKTIKVCEANWTAKSVNRFIKHWIKGSNPRMELLKLLDFSDRAFIDTDILKDVHFTEVPADQIRWFKNQDEKLIPFEGGKDFYRQDGTKATIYNFGSYENFRCIAMCVWHPHCIHN
ncbi:hypothetical protein GCK72_022836 [Caenorhabditis remanei]|uniref:F-box domain-containing protein n=1 Tax=Caenorhabditis remanei TaxID=31234 RepID=A0A6A5FUZ2_CAERE|nr:hypothetical protein GCK72_022836 [Caenorhabditis remanei]KAF1746382.1 hypothetical protein GCK72_022836 [Caenorhabditis remanei]